MSDSKKTAKPEDLANAELAQALAGAINEKALHDWFNKSAGLMAGKALSARGWNATVEASNVSSAFRSTWGAYVLRASLLQGLTGGRDVPVKLLFTTTQDAVRHEAYKGEGFERKVKASKSFADFRAGIPARDKQTNDPKSVEDFMKAYVNGIQKLEDIAPTDTEVWTAFLAMVEAQRKAIITRAKHPSKKSA